LHPPFRPSLYRNEQLNIKVKDADGNEVFFKVKKHTRLAKLKRAYAEKMGKQESSVRFITSDGNRVGDEDTAETVSIYLVTSKIDV
jgi:small ubiquitin-related modifier